MVSSLSIHSNHEMEPWMTKDSVFVSELVSFVWRVFCVFIHCWRQKLNILLFIEIEHGTSEVIHMLRTIHHGNYYMYLNAIQRWKHQMAHVFFYFFYNQSFLQISLLFYNFVDALWHPTSTKTSRQFNGFFWMYFPENSYTIVFGIYFGLNAYGIVVIRS